MLPATARLTHRDDFTAAVRHGRRIARRLVMMHVLLENAPARDRRPVTPARPGSAVGPRVGFIVSKAVGGSVQRHQVVRRLRHLMRSRLTQLPSGARVVIRALPASAGADSASLGLDVDEALASAMSGRRTRVGSAGRGEPSVAPGTDRP